MDICVVGQGGKESLGPANGHHDVDPILTLVSDRHISDVS